MRHDAPPDLFMQAQHNDRRYALLVHSVVDYAIYLLDREGRIASWNRGAERIKGYTAEEIVGAHFSHFYTPEDQAEGRPAEGLEAARQNGTFQTEAWRVRKDGSHFWASVVIDAVYDEDGELFGYAKVTRDITEHKRAQEQSDRRRDALHQSQKLEALGRLTGSVAHDFNNLLAVIRTAAELLQSRTTLTPEKRAHYLGMIADTTARAARLTEQLLVFSRRHPLSPEVFKPESRISSIREIIETTLGSKIKFEVDFAPDAFRVEADPSQFETAVLNMIINARDATPEGGVVAIRVVNSGRDMVTDDGTLTYKDVVAVSVSDTGTGIDPSLIQNIFEPFFTTKGVHKGTGLGLSQVYGFARQSGGEITVESQPGKGATFTLYLPSASGDDGWGDLLSPGAQQTLLSD